MYIHNRKNKSYIELLRLMSRWQQAKLIGAFQGSLTGAHNYGMRVLT